MRERVVTSEIVEVLLATFNGERFLREQIDSVLAQDYANLRILARDDGSTDRTLEILRDYESRFPARIRLLPTDEPTGSAKWNFLKLMQASSAEYVCFCDQDDVWLPGKVSLSMSEMQQLESRSSHSTPCLVFTDLQVVDSRLEPIHASFWEFMGVGPETIGSLKRLLLLSVVTGSTALVNRPLLDLAKRMPREAVMHDRWIGLISATMGTSSALKKQTVLYRQHGNNLIGTGQDLTKKPLPADKVSAWKRMRDYRKGAVFENWIMAQGQAKAFLAVHGNELRSEVRRVFEVFRMCGMDDRRLIRLLSLVRFGFDTGSLSDNLQRVAIVWNEKCGC
jgi:glycosyltransferase involved in cell wall biosynthesis